MDRQEWLDSLKAGDTVVLGGGWFSQLSLTQVLNRTSRGKIVLENGYTFSKNGNEVGGDKYRPMEIEPYTQEVEDEMTRKKLAKWVSNTNFNALSLEALRKVADIVEEEKAK